MAPHIRLTIVTPALNAAATIADTIESVLSQGYPDLQYIMVDGGSTDGTLDVVARYGEAVQLLQGPDAGMYDALAKGFEQATGEVFGYLNADDMLEPMGLWRAARHFADNPTHRIVAFDDSVQAGRWRFPNIPQPAVVNLRHLLNGHILYQDGVFFRADLYREVGGFDRSLRLAGDWELWVRMAARAPINRGAGHVSCFRIRDGQLGADLATYRREMADRLPALAPLARQAGGRLAHFLDRGRNLAARLRGAGCVDITVLPLPAPAAPEAPECFAPATCPITGEAADRLLFTSPDTRFGQPGLYRFYLHSDTGVAICHPPLPPEELAAMNKRHYGTAPSGEGAPPPAGPSPRQSPCRDVLGGPAWLRLALRSGGLAVATRILARLGLLPRWPDDPARILRVCGRGADEAVSFLDVGCGDGRLLADLAGKTRWSLHGLDPASTGGDGGAGPRIHRLRAAEAAALPPELRFDLIHLGEVLEHLEAPIDDLAALKARLRPGGRIVLTTPNRESTLADLFGPTWAHWHPPFHRAVYSPRAIRRLASACGLRVVAMTSHTPPHWAAMSCQLNKLGLLGRVGHSERLSREAEIAGTGLALLARLLWDRRVRGDDLVCVLERSATG